MSCDISHVFAAMVSTIRASNPAPPSAENIRKKSIPTVLNFNNRAKSLFENLHVLANYLKRIHGMTSGCILNNSAKQRMHAQLTDQVTVLVDECSVLLGQLSSLIYVDDSSSTDGEKQFFLKKDSLTSAHRLIVHKMLGDRLNELRKMRDFQIERQKRLLDLSGSLASGVRSVLSTGRQVSNYLSSTDENVRRRKSRTTVSDEIVNNSVSVESDPTVEDGSELRVLKMENETLYRHLMDEQDDVRQVAQKISEIGRLNQTLSEHLTQQLETVEQIEESSIAATEYIRQGNDLYREVINRKASMQFWIIFILLVLTFSLHFLDWYYP